VNPYPPGFLDLLEQHPDGRVLDCGAGGRTHPRILSVEMVPHPNNTVQADGRQLPFRADSFALVLSQAVLEHVPDPQAYVDELERVLAPGGLLWIEAAFLQPVHQAPWHFQNFTPFGLAEVCRAFEIVEQASLGSWAEWWEWVACEIGADAIETGVVRQVLAAVDERATIAQRFACSSGVRLLARKR